MSLEDTYDMLVSTSLTWSTCLGRRVVALKSMLTFLQASDLLCASQTSEAPWRNARIGFRGNVTGGNELLVNSTGIRQVEPTGDRLI